jgi:hypothetical protein
MKNKITPKVESDLKQLRAEFDEKVERSRRGSAENSAKNNLEFVKKWGDSEAFSIEMDNAKKEQEERKEFWEDYIAEPTFDTKLTAYIKNNKELIDDIIDKYSYLNDEYIKFIGSICFALYIGGEAGKIKVEHFNNNLVNIHRERLPILEALAKDSLLMCLLNLPEEKVNELLEDFNEHSNSPVNKYTTTNTYLDLHIYNFIIRCKKDTIRRARQIDVLLNLFQKFNLYGYASNSDKFQQNRQFENVGKRIDYISTYIKEKFKS